ncbi:MAG: carboxypeptidase-like regulatory domain-containing protein [Chitinophagales bacterium]|nr:carboxypeptidase-like regulatory domain-containing protein [Chitinophagales bacterium]
MKFYNIKKYMLAPIILLIPGLVSAQSLLLKGKVTDQKNAPVAGASVSEIRSGMNAMANESGYFQIVIAGDGSYEIVVSAIGYESAIITGVLSGQGRTDTIRVILAQNQVSLDNVVIKVPQKASSINSMIRYQKNSQAVAQVLSSEAIGKSPDKNSGDALKRVTGLSIQEGRYVNVRGLGDRYNQATVNGVLLSSSEPDRKAFSFDLFPVSMVENIVINKTFLPEYSGEWAGGLIQINTKNIPAKNFLDVQVGLGMNTQTINQKFYKSSGGKLDWLGFDDGTRGLPSGFPGKNAFANLSEVEKNNWGKVIAGGDWGSGEKNGLATIGQSLRVNGGLTGRLAGKEVAAIFSGGYNRSLNNLSYHNSFFNINDHKADESFAYNNRKNSEEITIGGLGNFSLKLNDDHEFYFRNLISTKATIHTTRRTGKDYEANASTGEDIRAVENGFKSNILFNTQLGGTHQFRNIDLEVGWFGSFGILDQYIPNQRRLQYNRTTVAGKDEWQALISNTLSQKTGSVFYSTLSDYLYNAGVNLKKSFKTGANKQTVKAGYNLQVKDRLYNARPFAISISGNDQGLKGLDESSIFLPDNFGGSSGFGFDEISGMYYRYMANSILHAGYVQFENSIGKKVDIAWGVRYEHFDQVVGSKEPSDPRYTHSAQGDFLPGVNFTLKLDKITNLRIAASQTVIRPEFRELTGMAFYDFELGATIVGNPNLARTKVTHLDLRYEIYPASGELVTAALFYKHFDNPIEMAFNQSGAGSSNTFNYPDNQSSYAETYGAEIEVRKKLSFIPSLKNLVLHGNFSYIFGSVHYLTDALDRPMQGQSPYLLNLGIDYESKSNGWSGSLLFNQFGRRILYVGNDAVPAVWEAPRPLVDLQLGKEVIGGKGKVTINVTDLLNSPARFYHDLNGDKSYTSRDALVIQRNNGTGISVSFLYKIK